jgi:hypothetical protein
VHGRIPASKGRETFGKKYVIGAIFYDHSSGYIVCVHQSSLRATDTIISNRIFERHAKLCGVKITPYHGDNAVFKSREFLDALYAL